MATKTNRAKGKAMPRRQFPAHLSVNGPAEWRALKRTEWREVTQALERYHHGAAYAPAGNALYRLDQLARQITEALEADDWIVW